ncbi:MAG TPA: nickel pincer cofactor biosynthesis protein LarB [Candidatus Methylacidiphilales bacterium]
MNPAHLLDLLTAIREGKTTPQEGMARLVGFPYEDLGYAKIDHHRALRTGMPEVIYAAGKTDAEVAGIFARMAAAGGDVLATRVSPSAAAAVREAVPAAIHHETARIVALRQTEAPPFPGTLAVLAAGTSDLPVAEEAAVTAEFLGNAVARLYDVGVAGLHRLLAQGETLSKARACIVCAGMEGALATVVAGLVRVPVVAVPTSVGYGAAFGGVAALLGMLNSCSPNLAVVNIDNGFGAAAFATAMVRGPLDGASPQS